MYHSYFGLSGHPFKLTPDTSFFFEEGQRKAILNALIYALKIGDGIIKLTGEVGSGKTFLSRILEKEMPKNFEFIFLLNPNMPPENVLSAIARDLGLAIPRVTDKLQVLDALQAHLLKLHANNRQVVVVIDEAQSMPSETLEEVRLLSNLETESHKLLQIVLIGQPELDEHLNRHNIRQIKERITHNLYLPSLNRSEIHRYIDYRLRCAGYKGAPIFSKISTGLIALYSRGLLRRINILADKALLVAFSKESRSVTIADTYKSVTDSYARHPNQQLFRKALLLSGVIFMIAFASQIQWDSVKQTLMNPGHPSISTTLANPVPSTTLDKIPVSDSSQSDRTLPEYIFQDRLSQTYTWIKQSTQSGYSIQLLQTYTNETKAVRDFVAKIIPHSLLENIFIFPVQSKEKTLWSIFYGQFNNYQEASAALEQLDSDLKKNRPFIVSQNNIRALYQQEEL